MCASKVETQKVAILKEMKIGNSKIEVELDKQTMMPNRILNKNSGR
jgi:hypothetical protein